MKIASTDIQLASQRTAATPFSLKTNENELLGQVCSSGVVLDENGTAGSVQQIDLVV